MCMIVIELHPYENDTDSLLFDGKSKKDKNVLEGKVDFEFGIQEKDLDEDDMWPLLASHQLLVEPALKGRYPVVSFQNSVLMIWRATMKFNT